ncbi:MAG TPA: hypothetical protein VKH44_00050, partial [Pirellulaceae bacterium]|nr:hypothetical protein [Pirellulaceae bacterium]
RRFQFNIIHPSSGLKVDCILVGDSEFDRNQIQRALRVERTEVAYAVQFATPEDVILKKIEYFKLGQSEKHTRDICGILRAQGDRIDREYIRTWAEKMGLTEIWDAIVVRVGASR